MAERPVREQNPDQVDWGALKNYAQGAINVVYLYKKYNKLSDVLQP